MDRDLERYVSECDPCQQTRNNLHCSRQCPWERVHVDFAVGKMFFTLVDSDRGTQ